jgi:hypothetical protein
MTFSEVRRVWRRAAAPIRNSTPAAPRGLASRTSQATASSTSTSYHPKALAFARHNDIGISEKLKRNKADVGEKRFGIRTFYHRRHQINAFHVDKLVTQHPLTPMLESIYQAKKKNPLWSYFHDGEFDSKSYVRESAKKKCRRAFLGALKASQYRPNGKALAVDSVRGTEIHGTIKMVVLNPQEVVRANMPMLIEHMTLMLRDHIIPELRRDVTKPTQKGTRRTKTNDQARRRFKSHKTR